MEKKRAVLIQTNLLDRDPRLTKEIDTLKRGGYAVTLLCWDRDCKGAHFKQHGVGDSYREIRLRLKAPYGVRILPFLPMWWCFVFCRLMLAKWDMAHAINLDSIIPTLIVSKIKRKHVIYEMFDTYEDEVALPRWLRTILVHIDKLFMRLADAVAIVDESRINELDGIPNDNVVVIYNSPHDILVKSDILEQRRNSIFTIFYAGLLTKGRSLDKVIMAIQNVEDVKLIIAGYGDFIKKIKKEASQSPEKVQFIGQIAHTEVLKQTLTAQVLFSLYDASIRLHRFASSNKLFEAMMCRKPILVSEGTTMADIVRKCNCGIVVNCRDVTQIRSAIVKLKDNPELCRQLGANGRKAYEQRYNWKIMEQRLLALYQELTGKVKQGPNSYVVSYKK